MSTFATRLKELREEKGHTQEYLAKKLKTSRSRIGMYEQGKREPNFETLEAIADFYNVDLDYLQGRSSIKKKVSFDYLQKEIDIGYSNNIKIEAAVELYYKYLSADKKTRKMIDLLLSEDK